MVATIIILVAICFIIRDSITKYVYITKPQKDSRKPLKTRAQFIEESLHPQDTELDVQTTSTNATLAQLEEPACNNVSNFQSELQSVLQTKEDVEIQRLSQENLELNRRVEFEYSTIKEELKEKASAGDYSINKSGQKVVHTISTRLTYGLKHVSSYSPYWELKRSGSDVMTASKIRNELCTVVVSTTPYQQKVLDQRKSMIENLVAKDNILIRQIVISCPSYSVDIKKAKEYPFPAIADVDEHMTHERHWCIAFEYSCIVP